MKKLVILAISLLAFGFSLTKAEYSKDFKEAYTRAFNNSITTQPTIDKANMNWDITRIELSKMISNYAIKTLKKKWDTSKKCVFTDVTPELDKQYDNWVTNACQLGLMWQGITKFRPYDKVTRAEFWTILSRILYWEKYNWWNPYYDKHLLQLYFKGIMRNTAKANERNEVRWNVMVMLKRSKEAWNEDYIPSFEELDDDLHVICHWEDEFWYEYDSPIKKSAFILPYKDWYFDFSIYGQDWQSLFVYYRLKNNPCTTYLNSDDILWRPGPRSTEDNAKANEIYEGYDWASVKKLNCKAWNYDLCEKEFERYAYNLLVWKETNERFSLRMKVLKRMVDNKEYDEKSSTGYFISWSANHYDCYLDYERKTQDMEHVYEYCQYKLMWLCPWEDFCKDLEPKLDEQFWWNNVIYWKDWNNEIVWDNAYFYSEKYWIKILLWKDFSWWMTSFRERQNEPYVADLLITTYNKDNDSYDILWRRWQEYGMVIDIYDVNKDISKEIERNKSTIIGKNNKYQFTKRLFKDNIDYKKIEFPDVK